MAFYQIFILASLTVLTILVLLISRNAKKQINSMQCMMITMFFSMNTGLTVGILFGASFQGDLFFSTILACLIGSVVGLLIGMNYSLLSVLEGIMTGLMSGMMGAMLGEMINEDQSIYLVRIFLFLSISTLFLFAILPRKNGKEYLQSRVAILKPLLIGIFITAYFLGGVTFAEKQVKIKEPLIHNNHSQPKTEDKQAIDSRDITIQTINMKYSSTEIVLEKGQQVNLILSNQDNVEHDIEVIIPNFNDDSQLEHKHRAQDNLIHLHAKPKETQRIGFTPTMTGSFEFICTVPGHKESGMVGKIVVK
ncbi:plastocyanin/azurin family copper-binding protein [Solibacillus sp. FSL R7-0668]|uniref:plastocyanin/azurin family copper-binding protein n=1 Tax=Solibacillus sp. FSL R7-0668 TaxID=2921688 RepID=UPI0030F50B2F